MLTLMFVVLLQFPGGVTAFDSAVGPGGFGFDQPVVSESMDECVPTPLPPDTGGGYFSCDNGSGGGYQQPDHQTPPWGNEWFDWINGWRTDPPIYCCGYSGPREPEY
jgi:hypothetical protein